MRATIVKEFAFEAAHQLPSHQGKCANFHGHSYRVEVAISGTIRSLTNESTEGMVLDFAELKAMFQPFYDSMDHATLNDLLLTPTAERIAAWLFEQLERVVISRDDWSTNDLQLEFVRVHETATSYAEVRSST